MRRIFWESRAIARERYGELRQQAERPPDQHAPEDASNKHGPAYDNDTPRGWLTGAEPATSEPGFDRGQR